MIRFLQFITMSIESFNEYKDFVRGKKGPQLANCKHYLNEFVKWAQLTPKQLIEEAINNNKEQLRGVPKGQKRIEDFFTYLTTDYIKKKGKNQGKPMGGTTARTMCYALKKFYSRSGIYIDKLELKRVVGKKENKRLEYSPQDARKAIETATSKRDKTLITFGYQGGFDAKTVTNLNLGDFSDKDLSMLLNDETPETPILLHLVREKEGVDHHTCLGYDSMNFFRAYLTERRQRGEKLNLDSPAFVLDRTRDNNKSGRMKEHLLHHLMRTVVVKAGIVSQERLDRADFNIAGYHSLRATFSRRLEYAGMSPAYIDYMQGHRLPHNGAYRSPHPKKLLEKYKEFEHVLSLSQGPKTLSEIEDKLQKDIERLQATNDVLTSKVLQMEQDFKTIKELIKWEKVDG